MIGLLKTSEWQEAFLFQFKDGSFGLFSTMNEAAKEQHRMTGGYMEVKYNYNKGQPIVRFEDGNEITIVDLEKNNPKEI